MHQVKHRFNFCPNVGTTLLFAAGLLALPCSAAYTVIDLPGQRIATSIERPFNDQNLAQDFPISFFENRSTLGPKGRRALASILESARTATAITIVGAPFITGDTATATARCNTIRGWFISRGIVAKKIHCAPVATANIDSADPHIANSRVQFGDGAYSPRPAAPTMTPAAAPSIVSSTPDPSEVDAIVADFAANRISREEALSRIFRTDIRPRTNAHRIVSQQDIVMTTPSVMPRPDAARSWLVRGGQTLKSAIEEWAKTAGWNTPVWEVPDPYMIESGYPFQGTLLDALTQLNELVPQLDFHVSLAAKTIRVTVKQ